MKTKAPFAPGGLSITVLLCVMASASAHAENFGQEKMGLTDWNIVYQATYLKTIGGDTYSIHSPAFNLKFRSRGNIAFVSSTTILIPGSINNNGERYSDLSQYYSSRVGLEQIFGLGFIGSIGTEWRWRAAPGWSLNGISMPGVTGYYPFQSLTTGPALLVGFDSDWKQGIYVHITGAVTYQFIDLIHSANKLDYGVSGHIGIGIGFKKGAFRGKYMNEK